MLKERPCPFAPALIAGVIAAALNGCTGAPREGGVTDVGAADRRFAEDRIRERAVEDLMHRPADMVRVDQDVRAYRQRFGQRAPRRNLTSLTSAPPIPLPGLRLNGSGMTLEDAVALAAHSIGWGFRFAGPTERAHPIELQSQEWTLKSLLGELEYQTHHYVNAFPESRLIMVTRQRMYLAPPGALKDNAVPSSLPESTEDCVPCAGENGDDSVERTTPATGSPNNSGAASADAADRSRPDAPDGDKDTGREQGASVAPPSGDRTDESGTAESDSVDAADRSRPDAPDGDKDAGREQGASAALPSGDRTDESGTAESGSVDAADRSRPDAPDGDKDAGLEQGASAAPPSGDRTDESDTAESESVNDPRAGYASPPTVPPLPEVPK